VHHSFAVAGRQQRVVLPADDGHQVPQVAAAPRRLKANTRKPSYCDTGWNALYSLGFHTDAAALDSDSTC